MPVVTEIELRRGTAAAWTAANPVLSTAEPGYETDTGKLKIGDNVTAWNSLAYFAGTGLSPTLTDAHIFVGNGSNVATDVAVSGDLTLADTGAFTIANLAVTNAKIANSTIDLTAKVTGSLPVANGGTGDSSLTVYAPLFGGTTTTGAIQSGTVGTAGQVLTSNGAGALPTFQAAGGGGSELVLLATATASSSASLNFTSVITSAYTGYYLVVENLLTSTTCNVDLKLSTNNGSTFAASALCATTAWTLNSGSAPSYDGTSGTMRISTNNASSTYCGFANISIQGSGTLAWWGILTGDHSDNTSDESFVGKTSTGINAFQLLPTAGTFTSGKVYLYGIKNT